MTDFGEMAAIDLILEHDHKCPLCETEPPPESKPSNADQSPDEDAFVDDHTAIGNDSGVLDSNMAAHNNPRPKDWIIELGDDARHRVTPNPHHLIPGNESLKPSKVLDWIFASKGKVKADIGYDVNNHRNGKWLPSNNSMRGDSTTGKPSRWTPLGIPEKTAYVVKAMDVSHGHFHDRHGKPYSDFVKKVLNAIADRLESQPNLQRECPYATKKSDGKYDPPYWLYQRLNGVSQRLGNYLTSAAAPHRFVYTSKFVPLYWEAKNLLSVLKKQDGA